MPDLSVDVDRNDIVVSKPSAGLSVTYRRAGRVLVALDSMRNDPKGEELRFLVRAWNAAFANRSPLHNNDQRRGLCRTNSSIIAFGKMRKWSAWSL